MESIEANSLSFSYKDNQVISNIDICIQPGEFVSLIGPNGSGKTTLLKMFQGILVPSHGSVTTYGKSIADMSPKERATLISVVPQNPEIPKWMTLSDFVMLGRNAYLGLFNWEGEKDIEAAKNAMTITDIWDISHRKLSEVSGGEMQRAMIALAIAQSSPVMLLDEPTANLDLKRQIDTLSLIKKNHIIRQGITLIAIHDLTLAGQLSDRIIMLDKGNMVADGTPEQVLTKQNLETAYDLKMKIIPHPLTNTPVVLPISPHN